LSQAALLFLGAPRDFTEREKKYSRKNRREVKALRARNLCRR
jgi:hypothetical protein